MLAVNNFIALPIGTYLYYFTMTSFHKRIVLKVTLIVLFWKSVLVSGAGVGLDENGLHLRKKCC